MSVPIWLVAIPMVAALAGEAWPVVSDALMCRRGGKACPRHRKK